MERLRFFRVAVPVGIGVVISFARCSRRVKPKADIPFGGQLNT